MAEFNRARDRIRSNSVPNVLGQPMLNVEESDDVLDQRVETPSATKIDINTLKNEILTDGMQVSATEHTHTHTHLPL